MKKIESIRKGIDAADKTILEALKIRLALAREVAAYKKTRGEDIYRPEREEKILRAVKKGLAAGDAGRVADIFRNVISSCRGIQKTLKIAYLGPVATFTHQASMKIFGKFCTYVPLASIPEVFEEVETGRADYGVVPVENSTGGMESHTLDKFITSTLKIINEEFLPISQCLISSSSSIGKIKKVYSHPNVFHQCRNYLAANLPRAEKIEVSSTAQAVKNASREKTSAAIASRVAAEIYKIKILDERIEDLSDNYTRFLVLGENSPEPSGRDKTSLVFSLKDRPGILHDALAPFKKRKINLTRIESRPSRRKAWEYFFFVDCEGHTKQKKIREVIDELSKFCDSMKILGSFPRGQL